MISYSDTLTQESSIMAYFNTGKQNDAQVSYGFLKGYVLGKQQKVLNVLYLAYSFLSQLFSTEQFTS